MKGMISEYVGKYNFEDAKEESKLFYEMLIINYSSDKEKFQHLKDTYAKFQNYDEKNNWKTIQENISMLVYELETFNEIYKDFKNLQLHNDKEKLRQTQVQQKIDNLSERNNSEDQKMLKINQNLLQQIKANLALFDSLLGLVSERYIKSEIVIMKERKKQRFGELVKCFGDNDLRTIENKIELFGILLKEQQPQ